MIKKLFILAVAATFTLGTISCREESDAEKIKDGVEDVADDIEDSVD
ncbi:MAG: hypothetical protein WBG46_03955 [Nonlabens sp.]